MVYVANIKIRVVSKFRGRFARDGVGGSRLMRALLVMRMETKTYLLHALFPLLLCFFSFFLKWVSSANDHDYHPGT